MKANNTYNVIIANEAYNFTSTKYNTILTGFTSSEAASNAAREALRDIAGEMGKGEKVLYSEALNAWILSSSSRGIAGSVWYLTAKVVEVETVETTTPETSDTMNTETNTVEFSDLSHAGQCLDIYLHNTAEIYQRYTVEAVRFAAGLVAFGWDYVTDALMNGAKVKGVEVVNEAINAAVRLVKKYDHKTPTAKDLEQVMRNYVACIIDNAKYEV